MELHQLFREVRKNWVVAVATMGICLGIGIAVALLPAKQYKATATVYAQPSNNPVDSLSSVDILGYIVPQLPGEATNPTTLNAARASVPSRYANANVSIDAASDPGTGIITIDATSANPEIAAAYANAVANRLKAMQPKGALYVLRQLSPAPVPSSPDNPRLPTLIAAGGIGVILGIFAAVGAGNLRRRLSRANEIQERIGASVLGEIPKIRGGVRPVELYTGDQPVGVEAFQELRSNILLAGPPDRPFTIAVTSCGPDEGKTSVASNIGWTLAASDRPVTLVDSDLRHPSLHLMLDVPFGPGVSSRPAYALEHASLANKANLQVVPAGNSDRHPSDIMAANLPQLLDALSERNNTVIIDCPPVIGAAETVLIASLVDFVLVVVDTRRYNPERLQQCILRLEGAGNAQVFVVLNRVRMGRRRRMEVYHYVPVTTRAADNEQRLGVRPRRGGDTSRIRARSAASNAMARQKVVSTVRRPIPNRSSGSAGQAGRNASHGAARADVGEKGDGRNPAVKSGQDDGAS